MSKTVISMRSGTYKENVTVGRMMGFEAGDLNSYGICVIIFSAIKAETGNGIGIYILRIRFLI